MKSAVCTITIMVEPVRDTNGLYDSFYLEDWDAPSKCPECHNDLPNTRTFAEQRARTASVVDQLQELLTDQDSFADVKIEWKDSE